MAKEIKILQFIEGYLQQNQSVILMIVVQSLGSSPGRAGFKMVVTETGKLLGSIGGGVMEENLVEVAKEFLKLDDDQATEKFGHSFVFSKYQDHRKDRPNSSGMICSGKQRVLFCKIAPNDLEELQKIKTLLLENSRGILSVSKNNLSVITPQMSNFNDLWSVNGKHHFFEKEKQLGYLEKLGFNRNLYIVGGGHCALALSELMSKLDFYISLFDDRPNLNTLEKNRFAHSITIIESYEKIADFVPSGEESYVVVMTLGYKFDEIVIRRLFEKQFKYFGVLGSRAKMKTLLKSLENEGFDKEKLARIRTPIGLQINSQTPEEIAVSIAAEIIAVKNGAK